MEILKLLSFIALGLYIFQSFYTKALFNWVTILIAITIHATYFFGWPGILFLLITAAVSTAAELISLKTPFNCFGIPYRYNLSDKLFSSKIVLGGVYPIEVTAAWILLKYLSFFLVGYIFSQTSIGGVAKAIISALALLSFDFLIDPFAVFHGTWKWEKRGIFFGVPWQNFLGWFLVGFAISLIFVNLEPIAIYEPIMVIPALIVCGLFLITLGRNLISMDKTKGILACLPLSLLIAFGINTLL
jgi:uncharacterized membrane protein